MSDDSLKENTQGEEQSQDRFHRFGVWHRAEHWIFMISFTILGMTGLAQKFFELGISRWFVNDLLGGIENTRLIHHIAATIMLLIIVYHIGAIVYRVWVQRKTMTMLPGMSDLRAAIQSLTYNLGINKNRPQQGRYGFEEKAEYWAVVWGTIIMAITGFLMWNPITSTRVLPGEVIPAAKAAHGLEAILAVAAIFLWHFYHVLVRTFNKSMFNGKLTEEQMIDEHPIEYADIKAGMSNPPVDPQMVSKRKRIFWPSYGLFAVAMLGFIYWFVNSETTAITTIAPPPAETVEIFVPLTPTPRPTPRPSPTPAPISAATWEAGIGSLIQTKCGGCHNGATKIGNLDLTTYQGALKGGTSGPAVSPGNPDNSQLLRIQSAGDHPGQLSPNEIQLIQEWIIANAPEK